MKPILSVPLLALAFLLPSFGLQAKDVHQAAKDHYHEYYEQMATASVRSDNYTGIIAAANAARQAIQAAGGPEGAVLSWQQRQRLQEAYPAAAASIAALELALDQGIDDNRRGERSHIIAFLADPSVGDYKTYHTNYDQFTDAYLGLYSTIYHTTPLTIHSTSDAIDAAFADPYLLSEGEKEAINGYFFDKRFDLAETDSDAPASE